MRYTAVSLHTYTHILSTCGEGRRGGYPLPPFGPRAPQMGARVVCTPIVFIPECVSAQGLSSFAPLLYVGVERFPQCPQKRPEATAADFR